MHPGTRPQVILGPTVPGSRRRKALGELLRNRRERLAPVRVNLPAGPRRRTPGLRREEVALLAGVSVAWYTWLEQARDIQPSPDALDAICGALRLTGEERAHAFKLAGVPLPDAAAPPAPISTPPQVQLVLDALAFPAYVCDRASNVIGWNALADAVFGYSQRAPGERNSLVIAFGDPAFKAALVDWQDEAGHLVANLRRAADEAPDDPLFEPLLARLRGYPEFRKLWARHDVERRHFVRKELRHPTLGTLVFETQAYTSAPFGLRLVVFVPDPATRTRLGRIAKARPRRR